MARRPGGRRPRPGLGLLGSEANEAAPHSYANRAVILDLERALGHGWQEADADEIRRVARELLYGHTAALEAAGADTVRRVVRR